MFFYQKAYNAKDDPLGRSRSRSPDFYAELRNNHGEFMSEKCESARSRKSTSSKLANRSRSPLERFYKVVSKTCSRFGSPVKVRDIPKPGKTILKKNKGRSRKN